MRNRAQASGSYSHVDMKGTRKGFVGVRQQCYTWMAGSRYCVPGDPSTVDKNSRKFII